MSPSSSAALAEAQPIPARREQTAGKDSVALDTKPAGVLQRRGEPEAEAKQAVRAQALAKDELLAKEQINPEQDCPEELAWIRSEVEGILANSDSSVEGKLIAIAEKLRVLEKKIRNKLASEPDAVLDSDMGASDEINIKVRELYREIRLRLRSEIFNLIVSVVKGQDLAAEIEQIAEAFYTASQNEVLAFGEEELIADQVITLLSQTSINPELRFEAMTLLSDWHFLSLGKACRLINSELPADFALSAGAEVFLAELGKSFHTLIEPKQLGELHALLLRSRKEKKISPAEEMSIRQSFRDRAMKLILELINRQTVCVDDGMSPITTMEKAVEYGFISSWGEEEKVAAEKKLIEVLSALSDAQIMFLGRNAFGAINRMWTNSFLPSGAEARIKAAKDRLS